MLIDCCITGCKNNWANQSSVGGIRKNVACVDEIIPAMLLLFSWLITLKNDISLQKICEMLLRFNQKVKTKESANIPLNCDCAELSYLLWLFRSFQLKLQRAKMHPTWEVLVYTHQCLIVLIKTVVSLHPSLFPGAPWTTQSLLNNKFTAGIAERPSTWRAKPLPTSHSSSSSPVLSTSPLWPRGCWSCHYHLYTRR